MNKQISALIRSLEALDHMMLFTILKPSFDGRVVDEAYKAINKALAEQPARQEPVAWMQNTTAGLYVIGHYDEWHCIPLYTSPPAQPQQQPVAWLEILRNNKTSSDEVIGAFLRGHAEYLTGEAFVITSPAQRKPLTDDELTYLWYNQSTDWMEFARAIEAKLKEKNT